MYTFVEESEKQERKTWMMQSDSAIIFPGFEIAVLDGNDTALQCGYQNS